MQKSFKGKKVRMEFFLVTNGFIDCSTISLEAFALRSFFCC